MPKLRQTISGEQFRSQLDSKEMYLLNVQVLTIFLMIKRFLFYVNIRYKYL